MFSVDLNMAPLVERHTSRLYCFLPGIGKHFIGNALCSSDDYVTQFIHIFRFFAINNIFYKQSENPKVSNLENKGAREWVPLFPPNDQEIPCPERHEHDGRSVVHHLTGKLYSLGKYAKHCSAL